MIVTEKKNYIAPQADTVELRSNALLAGSNFTVEDDNTYGPKEAESKESVFSSWDED